MFILFTGANTNKVVIPSSLFNFEQPIRIQLILTSGPLNGTASTQLQKNLPPSGGACAVNGKDHVFKQFNWSISCVNWTDPDGIDIYQFYGNLLTTHEIPHGLVFMRDNTENYHNSSNNMLFNNLKNILCPSNWI